MVKSFDRSGTLNLETSIQVDGTVDNSVIVNTFANYFAFNCSPFNECCNVAFKLQYHELESNILVPL